MGTMLPCRWRSFALVSCWLAGHVIAQDDAAKEQVDTPFGTAQVLQMPVRVAVPGGVGGLTDGLIAAPYATSIGLLEWAARIVTSSEPTRYESAPAANK